MAEKEFNPHFSIAVQDLLWALPQDREPLPTPFSSAYRLSLGQEAHRRPGEGMCWRAPDDPRPTKTEREVAVCTEIQLDQDRGISIRGRIDRVVHWDRSRIRACEIKSVFLPESRFRQIKPERYPAYVRQAQIYAWMLQQQFPATDIEARLILINQATQRHRVFDVPLDWEELDGFVHLHASYLYGLHFSKWQREQEKKAQSSRLSKWPFPALRTGQKAFLESADRALNSGLPLMVEAPTGMGKTVCALQSSLKYAAESGKRVLFLTAKGTQQTHVMETLRLISAQAFSHRTLQLLNKRSSCLNESFMCQPSSCIFLDRFGDRWAEAWVGTDLPKLPAEQSPTVVRHLAQHLTVCPFEVSRQLMHTCDVLVADYNYLFDPDVRLREFQSEDQTRDWVVIVDEGHNLIDRACDYYSAAIDFSGADQWLSRLQSLGRQELVEMLQEWIESLQDDLFHLWNASEGRPSDSRDGHRRAADFSVIEWEFYQQKLQEITAQYYLERLDQGDIEGGDPLDQFQWELNRFCLLVQDPCLDQEPSPTAQWIHATESDGFRAELFCLDPGPRLAPIWNELGGAIVMSATLSPMDFFRERLGLPVSSFQERFPSTILQEQRPVWIVPSINTAFSSRQKSSADLAALVEEAAEVSYPANIAVFFPSFAYLDMILRRLRPDLDRRMLVQTPSMDKEERDQILEALRSRDRGHLLMGVLGGIFAEGIDYKDTMLEGVIVVGPGLPALGPEREALRRYYQDLGMDGFNAAYAIPGIQRVLQAVGRLIRSESDRGFALLVGRRFQRPPYWGLLPPEWRALGSDRLTSSDWPDVILGFSKAFFREMEGQSGSESPDS